MTATIWVETSPETGPTAHDMPVISVHTASMRTKVRVWAAAR
ncbi:hypothetical protein J2Z30_002461 [Streptomyces iranensis]|nr:hypothetical protein [Streptomyces iranensis]